MANEGGPGLGGHSGAWSLAFCQVSPLKAGKKTDKKTAVKSVGQYFHFESVFFTLLQGYFHLDNQCQSPSRNLEDHPFTPVVGSEMFRFSKALTC